MIEDDIIEAWCRAIQLYYSLVRGDRLGELTGKRSRLIDQRGLHPLSLEVGRIMALQDLLPLLEEAGFNHLDIRRAAQSDAEAEHAMDIALMIGRENGWITSAQADIIRTQRR